MRPNTPDVSTRAALGDYIDSYATRVDGRLGVFLGVPTREGEFDVIYERNAKTPFASASVIKLPLLYALYAKYDGRLDELTEPYGIAAENRVGGSGLFHLLGEVDASLEDLARGMIAISDNTATNQLIDHLGMDVVNQTAARLGMVDTRLRRKMMVTLEETDFEQTDPSERPDGGPANVTTPRDCARFFADLHHELSLSANAYRRLRVPLAEQKYTTMFPRYLPYDARLEHKTGWIPSASLDTGLLFPPGEHESDQPIVFAVFLDELTHGADGSDVIAEIGDAVYAWLCEQSSTHLQT